MANPVQKHAMANPDQKDTKANPDQKDTMEAKEVRKKGRFKTCLPQSVTLQRERPLLQFHNHACRGLWELQSKALGGRHMIGKGSWLIRVAAYWPTSITFKSFFEFLFVSEIHTWNSKDRGLKVAKFEQYCSRCFITTEEAPFFNRSWENFYASLRPKKKMFWEQQKNVDFGKLMG